MLPASVSLFATSTYLLFLSLFFTTVDAGNGTVVDPTGDLNLNKNQAYNNALLCFKNTTVPCPGGYLNESGVIMPTNTDSFCQGGCYNQTIVILGCIDKVYADFRFNNKATTNDVRTAITNGCAINSTTYGNFTEVPTAAAFDLAPNMLILSMLSFVTVSLVKL